MTLNEPQCFILFGHHTGYHAPGLELGFTEVLTAAHNALLAHGKAAQIIRRDTRSTPTIGAAPVGHISMPANSSEDCIATAKTHTFAIERHDTWNNT